MERSTEFISLQPFSQFFVCHEKKYLICPNEKNNFCLVWSNFKRLKMAIKLWAWLQLSALMGFFCAPAALALQSWLASGSANMSKYGIFRCLNRPEDIKTVLNLKPITRPQSKTSQTNGRRHHESARLYVQSV